MFTIVTMDALVNRFAKDYCILNFYFDECLPMQVFFMISSEFILCFNYLLIFQTVYNINGLIEEKYIISLSMN